MKRKKKLFVCPLCSGLIYEDRLWEHKQQHSPDLYFAVDERGRYYLRTPPFEEHNEEFIELEKRVDKFLSKTEVYKK